MTTSIMQRMRQISIDENENVASQYEKTKLLYILNYIGQMPQIPVGGNIRELLTVNGRDFRYRPLPSDIRQGKINQCFYNATKLAVLFPGEFAYVEGIALAATPEPHGWCIDRQGNVIDPTWPEALVPGTRRCYYGVAFNSHYVSNHFCNITSGYTSLFSKWYEPSPVVADPAIRREALLDLTTWLKY